MLETTASAQGTPIGSGNCVLLRTGHGQLWISDHEGYNAGEPGIDLGAAQWLIARDICLLGAIIGGSRCIRPVIPGGRSKSSSG
jgi:kynurenine formamidase